MSKEGKKHTFVLTDSTLNSYGFRVMTLGLMLERFKKNPVMLYGHMRGSMMPIGKWENIRIDGDRLLADACFDADDDLAKKVELKVEKGTLKAASIGFDVIAISDDPSVMLRGQRRATVTQAEVYEASIVDIPGNANSLKLSQHNVSITLSGDTEQEDSLNVLLPEIENQQSKNDKTKKQQMKTIALSLGLAEDATQEQIEAAITKLKKEGKPAKVEAPEKTANEKLSASVIALGKKSGFITDKNEASFTKLAAADPDAALELITNTEAGGTEGGKAQASLVEALEKLTKGDAGKGTPGEPKTFDEYQATKEGQAKLSKMMTEKPEDFKKLYFDKYGVYPQL